MFILNKISKIDLYFFISTFVVLIIGIIFYLLDYKSIFSISLIIINVLFLFKFLNKIPVFILFFYIFLHSKIFALFYIWNFSISFWSDFQNTNEVGPVMISHLFFLFVLGNTISYTKIKEEFYSFSVTKPNFKIFWSLSIILVFILLFGIRGDNVFVSGGYSNFENVQKSTLHEYYILVYLFLILYSPKSRFYKLIVRLFLIAYIIKTLIYGGRIEVVQICLLFFYLIYLFKIKIKTIYILIALFLGIYFAGILSNIRSNPEIILSENYFSLFNPINVFELDFSNLYLSSTEGDVVQSSARMVGLINTKQLTITDRFFSFVSYLLSPIVPPSNLSALSNLSTYKQSLFQSGGGGLISTFFYCWLGYIGPIVAGLIIGKLISNFFNTISKNYYIYGLCLLTMFPRWFSYNPIFLIKFSLYAVIVFFLIKTIFGSKKIII
jgi:hypothetical protein